MNQEYEMLLKQRLVLYAKDASVITVLKKLKEKKNDGVRILTNEAKEKQTCVRHISGTADSINSKKVKALNEIKASLGWRVVYALVGDDPCGDNDSNIDKIFSRPPWWESIHFALEKRTTGGGIKSIANLLTRLNVKIMINFNFCRTSMYKSDLGDCHYACKYCNATYISGIEAAWGANKTKNKTEKGRE
ncbi:hypothetical protein Tco_0912127 [Tanacetum coccineum]